MLTICVLSDSKNNDVGMYKKHLNRAINPDFLHLIAIFNERLRVTQRKIRLFPLWKTAFKWFESSKIYIFMLKLAPRLSEATKKALWAKRIHSRFCFAELSKVVTKKQPQDRVKRGQNATSEASAIGLFFTAKSLFSF